MSRNVDLVEINKFDALAAEWWDRQGKMRLLHQINPLRLAFINKQAPILGRRILDVGCGGGILTEALAQQGAIVTGIDLSAELIKAAQQHALQMDLTIDYQVSSAEAITTKKIQYDIVTCMELLEHVPDPAQLIQDCAKLLKPQGFLFFSTINRNVKSFFYTILGAEYICNWLPKGTHSYEKFIRPSELVAWSNAAKLDLRNMQGLQYHLLSQQFTLSDDVSCNYLISFTKDA